MWMLMEKEDLCKSAESCAIKRIVEIAHLEKYIIFSLAVVPYWC